MFDLSGSQLVRQALTAFAVHCGHLATQNIDTRFAIPVDADQAVIIHAPKLAEVCVGLRSGAQQVRPAIKRSELGFFPAATWLLQPHLDVAVHLSDIKWVAPTGVSGNCRKE